MKFKLTSSQMNFYNKNFNLDSQIWNQGVMEIFPKVYSYDQINTAYNKLVENHDSLRVKLVETETGVVADVREHEFINYRFWQVETEEELMEKAQDFLNEPTDRYGLLVNCAVFQTPTTSGIMINAHHIVVDGYSVIVMAEHMNELLKDINFTPVIQKYSDYVEAEEKHKQSRRFDKAKDFWLKEFSNKPDFNIFTAKGNTFDFYSEEVNSVISKGLFYKVEKFCQENEISATSFFNTIYGIYFSKMYETSLFTMGIPVLNRTTQSEFNTIGLYMHVLPMVCNVVNDASFLCNAKQFEDSQMNLLRHQKFTQTDIKETLKYIDFEENNLFSVAADYQSFTTKDEYEVLIKYANYLATPLEIHLQSFNETLHKFKIRYRTSYFSKEEVEIMLKSIVALAENAVENPDKIVCELEMVSAEEKQKILYDFNNTTVEYPKDKGVYELFENQVVKTPDKTAVIFKDIKLTYSQLNDKIKECADRLNSLGLKADDVVAVHLERSYELIVFQLAILKIGAIFLPVDKRYPVDRIQQMCINCDVKLLITDELDKSSVNANVILLNDFNSVSSTKAAETVTNLGDCYIIYTSGSTGMPKGCLLTGKGLLNFCMNNNTLETLNYIEQPIFACVNSASFDYFIAETLLPLTNGFTTVVLDDNESTMQDRFLDVVTKNNINVIMTTPTRLKIYFSDKHNCSALKNMACICTSGEPLTPELLEQMYTKSPDAMVYNPIGPSECSVWDMGGRLEKSDGLDVHIGKPIANAQIYIVDRYLNPTPIGVTGEICIAGDGVGSGYINNPELTAERFIENPFGEGKLYKTGDLAYWRPDGNICYVGRNDFQVKVRGLRIELGEIESVLEAIDGVEHAVAVVRNDDQNRQLICAFYTGTEIDTKELRTILSSTLPRYMVPHIFTYLETLPMTVSGKLDRKALPEIDFDSISTETEFVAPETEEEKALSEVVCSVLRTESVNMLDNFFNVGGDSITAIYVVSDLEEKGYELHVADIMQSNTLSDVAKTMKSTSSKAIYAQTQTNGFIGYSPIMRAFLKEEKEIPKDFVHTCIISTDCDEDTVKRAIDILVSHHDILRGTFTANGIEIYPSDEREVYSFESVTIEDTEKAKEQLTNTRLTEDKLMRVVFCKTEKESLVSITVHHFLIDLVSWEVLIKDFNTITKQIIDCEEVNLPAKTASFKLWSEELTAYSETMPEDNKVYWNNIDEELAVVKSFNMNEEVNEAEEYSFTFDENTSDVLINDVNNTYGTRTNEVLLTALGLAAGKIAGGKAGIIVEGHGRTELHKPIATERTIGWFTSCYPVVVNNNTDVAEELINTKETLRRIPKNGIEYLLLNDGFRKNTDIIFNYYKTSLAEENGENPMVAFGGSSVFPGKINVNCFTIDNIVSVSISVPECNHKVNICEELCAEFVNQIGKIVDVCTKEEKQVKTRSDFSDDELTEIELKEIKAFAEDVEDIYALTPSQTGMYAQYFRSADTKTYQLQNVCKISKEADLEVFAKSVELLALRHSVLKTAVIVLKSTGNIKQVVLRNRKPKFSIIKQDEPFSQEALDKIVNESTKNYLDLQKDSLFRVTIADFADERFMLMHAHHIILDGWCLPVLINDLQKYYGKLINGTSIEELTDEINKEVSSNTSYAEYANWIKNQSTNTTSSYWQNLLADCEISHIFGKEKKDNTKNEDIITFTTPLGNDLSKHIEKFAKENKVSPNSVFECVFSIVLQKFSDSEDVVFDKVISGRSISLKNIENTVGSFINTVPVRIRSDANTTLADLLKETQTQTINANANGILPLAEVYRVCDIDAKSIDAFFVFENYYTGDMSDFEKGPLSPKLVSFDEQTEFNLTVTILKENNGYAIRTSYANEMYTEREIQNVLNGYISVLQSSLDEKTLIKDISVLTEDEKETVVNTFNNTAYTYDIPANTTIYSLFEEQAEKNEDKVCVIADDKEITFKEFKKYAQRIDNKVRSATNNEKSVIAVICERSFEMYGAVYGVIRGGNAYLPIDPNYPQERIDYILENSNAKAVITQSKFTHLAGNVPCINATEVLNSTETVEKTEILAKENDTAYVIYTSGSTGNPKGAKISHKSAVNRILWMHDFYPLEENDVILQKTPYTFDVSVWELFWWGMTGRTLCASKPDEHFLPAKILEETEKNKVTHLHFVPSVFDLFLTYLENNHEEQSKFNTVKYVFLSGEALTANHINRFYKIYDYNKVQLHNLYGPTECAVDVSYYPCVPTDTDPVPIGKPIYNTQLYIVDRYMNPTPIGVVGELCIGGVNVGQGYLNNEILTNEKFIDNPFREGKIYKTGDLAYWREDGEIIFCGRMDHQIKLNGQRIELGEIEKVIGEVDNVESVVVMIMQNNGKDVLVAYCCGNNVDKKYLKAYCDNKLPRYMVPSAFVTLDKMPLNASGKLDRKQLKSIEVVFEDEFVKEMPINDTEKKLCSIFERTLNIEEVGRNESFFSLGGTSIDMIAVLSESEMKNITPAQFIANPTPKKLTEILTEGNVSLTEGIEVLRDVPDAEKVLVVVPYAGGDATAYAKFVESMANRSNDMAIYYVKYLRSFDECKNIAETLAQIGKDKKLYIYSHCAGAAVAMQIINILEEMNVDICRYVAGGYIPPHKPLKKNVWNIVPDKYIKKRLISAGAPLDNFSDSQNCEMIDNFRKDTDFMVWYHYNKPNKIKAQTDVIISKTDSFTKNYKNAEKLWKLNADNFNNVYFIETDSHYFQSDNSDILVDILVKIFE